jgi:hypothetical protein
MYIIISRKEEKTVYKISRMLSWVGAVSSFFLGVYFIYKEFQDSAFIIYDDIWNLIILLLPGTISIFSLLKKITFPLYFYILFIGTLSFIYILSEGFFKYYYLFTIPIGFTLIFLHITQYLEKRKQS